MNDAIKIKKETAKMQMLVAHWGTKGLLKRYGEYAKDGTKISYKDTFSLCLKKAKELWGKNFSLVRMAAILDGREKEFYTEEDYKAELAKQPLKDAAIREMGSNYRKIRKVPMPELEETEEVAEDDELHIDYIAPSISQSDLWSHHA